ncbi:MAG: EAL domain-containing protein [Thiobacillus sp.]
MDQFKIDRSFIHDIPHDLDDVEIATAIIAVAKKLKVIAEGVETEEQLEFLIAQDCKAYQGYLNSRPLPADAFQALWQQQHALT